jgi:hypothetical protein
VEEIAVLEGESTHRLDHKTIYTKAFRELKQCQTNNVYVLKLLITRLYEHFI